MHESLLEPTPFLYVTASQWIFSVEDIRERAFAPVGTLSTNLILRHFIFTHDFQKSVVNEENRFRNDAH